MPTNWNGMGKGPYRSPDPKQAPAPRDRYQLVLRGDKHSDQRAAAVFCAGFWILSLVFCSAVFVHVGTTPYVLRWFGVEAGFALLWALIFVTIKPIG